MFKLEALFQKHCVIMFLSQIEYCEMNAKTAP